MTSTLRPLSLGELLDRTFHLYRQHFLIFVGIVALPGLMPLAMSLLPLEARLNAGFGSILLYLLLTWLASMVAMAVSQAATITAVSELHLGRSISLGGALNAARGRIVEICVVSIVVGLFIGLGLLLLIVPGVILALRWAIVIPVVVIERLGIRDAMERSADLTEGQRGRVFLIYALYLVVAIVIGGFLQVPIGIAEAMNEGDETMGLWLTAASGVASYVSECLVGPFITISMALFYYDQRVRKEAFDLDHMMSRLDETAGPSPATT